MDNLFLFCPDYGLARRTHQKLDSETERLAVSHVADRCCAGLTAKTDKAPAHHLVYSTEGALIIVMPEPRK